MSEPVIPPTGAAPPPAPSPPAPSPPAPSPPAGSPRRQRDDWPARRRVLGGYGPLVGLAIFFLLVAALVPTVSPPALDRTDLVAGGPGDGSPGAPDEVVEEVVEEVVGGAGDGAGDGAGIGEGSARQSRSKPGTPRPGRAGSGPSGGAPRPATGTVGGCDRAQQVPGDSYSPPCRSFSGQNGGTTSRGVTGDKIIVSFRQTGFSGFDSPTGGSAVEYDEDQVKRTVQGLAEYFNKRFQFYGRRLEVVFYEGRGSILGELQGAGQEEAEADAVKAAEEIGAFAEIFGLSAPYGDALARRRVISFGSPSTSREWLQARRPYVWSPLADCTTIAESAIDYSNKRLSRRPARHAGGDLAGKPRRIAWLYPDSAVYKDCVAHADRLAETAGNQPALRLPYRLDFGALSNQAASAVAKLKSESITTVMCFCDPAYPIFLTSKAKEQSYEPEWIVTGAGLVDVDVIGQFYEPDQWKRAFGISFLGGFQPLRGSYAYHAYRSVRSDEPSSLAEIFYYLMYQLAIGIQGAGPDLTPATFEAGMFAYPGGTGPVGRWGFGPGRYAATRDAREIYWDPTRKSPQTAKPGTYVETEPDRRHAPGEWPEGDPAVFP